MKLPKARTENLLEQNLKNETLIYDLLINKAFNLNETSTVVYKACNGITTFDELKRKHKFSDEFIYLALNELKRNNLLADDYQSYFAAANRREVIKRVGLATMFALPLITALVAPKAVNAASEASGGSGSAGNYDQACLTREIPVVGVVQYCNGGLDCGPTSRGGNRCCVRSPGQSTYFYSGEQHVERIDYRTIYYLPTGSPPAPDVNECSGSIRCCNGATPTGVCNYTLMPEEDDPTNTEEYTAYYRSCSCACP